MTTPTTAAQITFDTHPEHYRHWKLSFDGDVATLAMDVAEDGGLRPGYSLKLNSYDLKVDIELADAIQRLRFGHPEVKALIVRSGKERIFCAGANIYMLGASDHGFKVNFCKFTNETRLAMEEMSAHSGIKTVCAVNGTCAGGGYELALACDEIYLVDDGSSAVSLPEVPLLGVLPGTGGLTRVIDKRKVRRDHADFFSTVAEGIRGKRAVQWRLVDQVWPKSQFDASVSESAKQLAKQSDRPGGKVAGMKLAALERQVDNADAPTQIQYRYVDVKLARETRLATLTLKGPDATTTEKTPDDIMKTGSSYWPLQAFRELDAALLHLRFNEPEIGTIALRTEGGIARVLAVDAVLHTHREHWLVREILLMIKRTLKRLDMTAKTIYALVEANSCFAGSLFELALAADRTYMLNDPENPTQLALSVLNFGTYPMGTGLTRLQTRFWGNLELVEQLVAQLGGGGAKATFNAAQALEQGLVTFAPDEIDWEDEVRLALEERAALSPDALTGMEANLRFVGPETMETKIFGRLTAWQNWIFQRPNAVGEKGALKVYGKAAARPEFDFRRT